MLFAGKVLHSVDAQSILDAQVQNVYFIVPYDRLVFQMECGKALIQTSEYKSLYLEHKI